MKTKLLLLALTSTINLSAQRLAEQSLPEQDNADSITYNLDLSNGSDSLCLVIVVPDEQAHASEGQQELKDYDINVNHDDNVLKS